MPNLPAYAHLISAIGWHWPFSNGVGRFIDLFGKSVSLGSGIRKCNTSDGFVMNLMPDDLIGRHIILSGQFDSSIIRLLLDFAEPGDHCIDVGANIGYVSCLILSRVPGSRVLSVEPQPQIAALLRENLGHFDASRWDVLEAGLSDSETRGFMIVEAENHGLGRLVTDPAKATLSVPLLPAEQVLGALERLDIMKIDIEGHEETVLRSGADAIGRLQPRAILFEDQQGKAAPDAPIGLLLGSLGYTVFGVHKKLSATTLAPIRHGERPRYNDYLALSRQRPLPQEAVRRHRVNLLPFETAH